MRQLTFNPRLHFGIHDWLHVGILILAALGYAAHDWLWYSDDPFAAFNRHVIGEVGLDDTWVNGAPVKSHFETWSWYGRLVQVVSTVLIVLATCIVLVVAGRGLEPLWNRLGPFWSR